ncbi:hypothetical protein BHM03_00051895 [Ensete ventricosum]|nr:hypothetical protein BHM03_00051895 [Ensete ventricosum]
MRRMFAGRGCRPYLRQVGYTTTGAPHTCIRSVARVRSTTSARQLSEVKYLGRCKHCTSVSVPSAPPPSTSDSGGREGAPHGMASAVGVPAMRIRLAAQRQRKHENTAPHHLAPISFIPAVVGSCEMMGSQ